ncbi:hypothetical protein [Thermococcus sp. JdF3]|uniref:hypothetical protein n=1 Tax=Thermococcus sp. JdF3 TaxID=1638258 RepID=UPI00143B7467|nr:hypothetical protein [Thermococcus sp. JdF3]NJE00405.1 hypothetical protein [Thermococcus sp. JdF3]
MKFIIVKKFRNAEEVEEFIGSNNEGHPSGLLKLAMFLVGSFGISKLPSLSDAGRNLLVLIWGVLIFVLLPKLLDRKKG